MARNPHPTKKGPGRRHKDGQAHGAAPKPTTAAVGHVWSDRQASNEERASARRLLASMGGRRQYAKAMKVLRRLKSELRVSEVTS